MKFVARAEILSGYKYFLGNFLEYYICNPINHQTLSMGEKEEIDNNIRTNISIAKKSESRNDIYTGLINIFFLGRKYRIQINGIMET